jgi:hypothetical protein
LKPARSISTANPAVLVVAIAIANVASVRPSPKGSAQAAVPPKRASSPKRLDLSRPSMASEALGLLPGVLAADLFAILVPLWVLQAAGT